MTTSTKFVLRSRARSRNFRGREILYIEKGSLAAIPAVKLDVRPLTVLVGAQGTGKSLIAQILYFFREYPRLISERAAEQRSETWSDALVKKLLAQALDGLRSPTRRFAVFANPKVTLRYANVSHLEYAGGIEKSELPAVNLHNVTRQALPNRVLVAAAKKSLSERRTPFISGSTSVFVPTERLLYSQLVNRSLLRTLLLPSTFYAFSDWMEIASAVVSDWPHGRPDTPAAQWIVERGQQVLAGASYRLGDTWKWRTQGGTQFDIDMASSGQRANWPLFVLAAALCSLRDRGAIRRDFTLFVEEPEIHLHPGAQRSLMEALAFLVNQGFRVVVTTHSLVGIYTLNNLLVSSSLGSDTIDKLPAPEIRLHPEDVAVYLLRESEPPEMILDRKERFVSEEALGSVSDMLSGELNRIETAIRARD